MTFLAVNHVASFRKGAHVRANPLRDQRPAPSVASHPVTQETYCMFSMLQTAVKNSSAGSQGFWRRGASARPGWGGRVIHRRGAFRFAQLGQAVAPGAASGGSVPQHDLALCPSLPGVRTRMSLNPQRHCLCRQSPLGGGPQAAGWQKEGDMILLDRWAVRG